MCQSQLWWAGCAQGPQLAFPTLLVGTPCDTGLSCSSRPGSCTPGQGQLRFHSASQGEGSGSPLHTLAWKIPWTEEPAWLQVHGVVKSRTRLSDFTFTFHLPALEKEMATHSSVLAWRIPGTGEPGGLPSMGSHRIGHD